jgi:hypothetical protein
MHGSGRLTFPDGVCYEGSFVADSISGTGVSSAVGHHSEHCVSSPCCLLYHSDASALCSCSAPSTHKGWEQL